MFKKRSPKEKKAAKRAPVCNGDSDIEEITIIDDDSREAVKRMRQDDSDVDSDVSLE
jgi:hypothetical protein